MYWKSTIIRIICNILQFSLQYNEYIICAYFERAFDYSQKAIYLLIRQMKIFKLQLFLLLQFVSLYARLRKPLRTNVKNIEIIRHLIHRYFNLSVLNHSKCILKYLFLFFKNQKLFLFEVVKKNVQELLTHSVVVVRIFVILVFQFGDMLLNMSDFGTFFPICQR